MNQCFIAFGSNMLGDKNSLYDVFLQVLNELRQENFHIKIKSSCYLTDAFPNKSEPRYLNSCISVDYCYQPQQALSSLKKIENRMGRRENKRWSPRICDLDLLSFADMILPNAEVYEHWLNMDFSQQILKKPEELLLPHPRIQDRAFVLVPLAEIAPNWKHPVLGLTVVQMLDNLGKKHTKGISLLSS